MEPARSTPAVIHLDAHGIQVLAHPLRSRLLTALRTGGPATATALAATLDTNTGATSYHLRKLASVGLVEETGEGRGRERWWRAASDMHNWSDRDLAGDPDALAASEWLRGQYLRHFVEHAQIWLANRDSWPADWRGVSGSSDYIVDISAARMERLLSELYGVIERYRVATPGHPDGERLDAPAHGAPADGPTERVAIFLYSHPVDPAQPPTTSGRDEQQGSTS